MSNAFKLSSLRQRDGTTRSYHRGLSDRIASVFLLLALVGKQIDYLLSV